MITTTPEAYMAIVVLTRLYLLTLEHVAVGKQSIWPHQASGYQECASAGMAATSVGTISNTIRISGNSSSVPPALVRAVDALS